MPIASPNAVLAALALVAPVPPSEIARVPVIELAAKSTANSVDSMTKPPFAFRSTLNSFPFLSKPSPAVTLPLEENVLNDRLFVPTTADPLLEVQTKPISALVDPCSTKVNAPAASAPRGIAGSRLDEEDPYKRRF